MKTYSNVYEGFHGKNVTKFCHLLNASKNRTLYQKISQAVYDNTLGFLFRILKFLIEHIDTFKPSGFDETSLRNERISLEKHCELSTAIGTVDISPSGRIRFWSEFVSDSYTQNMRVAALMLTIPIGSCSVERCFSYSTRIGGDDKRKSLTIKHLQQLMRISQQSPELPAISDITWSFALCETGSWR